jgi:Fic-DOC domain mobile mystery protein B
MPLFEPIPGETPIDDISGLKIKGITLRRELNLVEAENIRKATINYFTGRLSRQEAPFDYAWALQLHREMFGDVWSWAGELRWTQTTIGVAPEHVETQLYDLFESIPYWNDMPWVEQAARLHHRAVQIHPFINGNGRWSRFLANVWLRLNGQPYTEWPEETVGETSVIRGEYLAAIKAADNGDYALLIGLHDRFARKD